MAHYLNLTMVYVGEHQAAVYDLDTRLIMGNKTLISMMNALTHFRYLVATHPCINLTSEILGLKENMKCSI